MVGEFAAAGAAMASATFLLRFAAAPPSWAKSAVKTIAVSGLAVAAWAWALPAWLIVALALGSLGDLALSRPGERAFLVGLASFALAHLAYVALFLAEPLAEVAAWRIGLGLGLTGLGALMTWRLWPVAGSLRGAVAGYVAVILAMGLAALGAADQRLAVAAMAFVVSDALLAVEIFLLPPGHRARTSLAWAVWIVYWAAQAMFLAAYALG